MTQVLLHRPARIPPPAVPSEDVVLATPPTLQQLQQGALSWLQYVFPMLGSAGALLFILSRPTPVFIAGGVLFALGSVGMGVGMFFQQRSAQRQRITADRQRYLDYLERTRQEIRATAARQRQAATWRHPHPGQLWAITRKPERVWERRPSDGDFLDVRAGLGPRPLATRLRLDLGANPLTEYEPVSLAEARRMVERQGSLPDMPVTVPLARTGVTSVVGNRAAARALVRALICQVATFHAPEDVRLAFCAGRRSRGWWDWAKWLPHAQHPEARDDAGPARLIAGTLTDLERLLGEDLGPRRAELRRATSPGAAPAPAGPGALTHLVVVIDDPDLGRAGAESALEDLARLPEATGVSLIWLVDVQRDEPEHVDLRIRVRPDGMTLERAGGDGEEATGRPDLPDVTTCEALARCLAPLRLSPESSERILVEAVGLNDLLGVPDPARLDPRVTWAPRPARELLKAPFGINPSGEPVILDFKESALEGMGPHGLVVGATGSGKSELLRTIVTALAIRHPPEWLAFVLVDFKGGATFAGMADLPHVAGMITNLEDDLTMVDRFHAALLGELRRRQELLKAAGNLASIHEYRQRREAGADLEPMPALLVIVDEFSELLHAKPDFIDMFVSIGRLGRSLGMHLLLASQRLEEGRLRGLESHLSYRIALRTFNAMESRIAIGRPDAFELPPVPGSGFLKVDPDIFERFKAAMVSGPYRPPEHVTRPRRAVTPFPAGNYFAGNGQGAASEPPAEEIAGVADPLERDGSRKSVMEVVVERLSKAAAKVHQVWLPPLPPMLTLDALLGEVVEDPERGVSAPGWPAGRLAVPIGLVDEPTEQRQEPLVVDLAGAAGHLAIVGASQTGKSTLLRTLMAAFFLTHTPDEAQFFCIDYGGGALAALSGAPHVGTVAGRLDPERVRRVVSKVAAIVDERERRFLSAGIDSVQSFRQRRAEGHLRGEDGADIFLVIDNWPAVRQDYDDLDSIVLDIATRGLGYGVHLVVTAQRWMDIRPNLRDHLGGRLELRLGDPLESMVDRREAENLKNSPPGRGLTMDKLQFQAALPRVDGRPLSGDLHLAVEELVSRVNSAWRGTRAEPAKILPTRVPFEQLPTAGQDKEPGVPIGLGELDLQPAYLHLGGAESHMVVFGDGESGKTAFLRTYLAGLIARHTPQEAKVLLIDYRRTLLGAVPDEYLAAYAGAAPAATSLVQELAEVLRGRLPGPDLSMAELRARSWWQGAEVYVVVDDYDLVVTPSGNPLLPLLEFLPQGRDLGFHVILARRAGGASRALYEPFLQRLRELGGPALLLSGDPQEGSLVGPYKATPQPPGRGLLIRRRQGAMLVQVAWLPPPDGQP